MGKWLTTTCGKCGDEVHYLPEWEEPKYCKDCAFYEEDCAICGSPIKIGRDWEHPPKVHKECREKAQAERAERNERWYDKNCRECGATFRVCRDWDHVSDYCKAHTSYEIDCIVCGKSLTIKRDWEHPPKMHKECKAEVAPKTVNCKQCLGSFELSTKLQIKCKQNGYELPTVCQNCKEDRKFFKAVLGAARDKYSFPIRVEIKRRGLLRTEVYGEVRNKHSGELLAEIQIKDEGLIFQERVATLVDKSTGEKVSKSVAGTTGMIFTKPAVITRDASTNKKTHITTKEKKVGFLTTKHVTQTARVNEPTTKPVTIVRKRGFWARFFGITQYETDK